MLLCVISDIHGNLPALEAVLTEVSTDPVDQIVCLGDVALGPQPAETLARVRALECPVVMGNWDAWAVDGFPEGEGDLWATFVEQGEWWAAKLSAEDAAFIRTFAPRVELELDGVPILCFHGSPSSYDDMILAATPHEDIVRMFAGLPHPVMVGGHSHVQLVRVVEGTLLVNPGSVGLPFRGIPLGQLQLISPWAEYALVRVDDGRVSVELRRTLYDVEEMLARTIESGVPHASWWAKTWVMSDPRPPARRGTRGLLPRRAAT